LRVRTEARRRAILAAARSVFEEQGFDRASMAEIAERLGGSKTTLYSYYPSKEDLFVACIEEDLEADAGALVDLVRGIPDLRRALEEFGKAYLIKAMGPRPIANYRMLALMPAENGIGRRFYEQGLRQAWLRFAGYLAEQMGAGRLRPGDPWVMAMHLKGMLEAEHFDRQLLNAEPEPHPATLERTADNAVEAFLRAYGPQVETEVLRETAAALAATRGGKADGRARRQRPEGR